MTDETYRREIWDGYCDRAYEYLGCHRSNSGYVFRVWAPNAKSVSVVGSFNNWDDTISVMQKVNDSGVWELFIENVKENDVYKYAILSKSNKTLYRADPYAFYSEVPPNTASKVYNLDGYNWQDKKMASVKTRNGNPHHRFASLQTPLI